MCGILTIFELGASSGERRDRTQGRVEAGLRALHHRGPDGTGIWIAGDGRTALGHARLSIIDTVGGQQPLVSADGTIHAVVNGEFYDFQRIRAELERRGHVFKTRSDSEILIYLYLERGPVCLESLRGEFAFALYDARFDRLFVARDRLGVKPLYVGRHEGRLFVSSEIKGLLAAGFPAAWDAEAYARRSFSLGDGTLFRGVTAVPPGAYLMVDREGVRVTRYWDLSFARSDGAGEAPRSTPEMAESIESALREAVRLRLVSDVPFAFYLSGGLDSSSVVAMAHELCPTNLTAFNISFVDDPDYDEVAHAETTAAHLGVDLFRLEVTAADLAAHFEEAVWHNEAPLFNAHGVAKMLLSRAVRRAGFKVVLTGEGADEIFAGYPHFRKDLLLASASAGGAPRVTWLEVKAAKQKLLAAHLAPELRADALRLDPLQAALARVGPERIAGRHPVEASMYLWAKTRLPSFVLQTLGDRMEMAGSVEGRVPFLDHELVELAARLPVSAKIDGRVQKHVLREAVRAKLPARVVNRKKHYFESPPAVGAPESPLFTLVQDELRSDALRSLPFFDAAQVRATLDGLAGMSRREREELDPVLTEIASLCGLQRRFKLST
jgi:asparagine synthase (glutamine-hydrolysing)